MEYQSTSFEVSIYPSSSEKAVLAEVKKNASVSIKALQHLEEKGLPKELSSELKDLKKSIERLEEILSDDYRKNASEEKNKDDIRLQKFSRGLTHFGVAVISMILLTVLTASIFGGEMIILMPAYFIVALFVSMKLYKPPPIFIESLNSALGRQEAYAADDIIKKTKIIKEKSTKIPVFKSGVFNCVGDQEKCMRMFEDRPPLYKVMCALAFATCIARFLVPFANKLD